jgi:hypothetical protein
MSREMFKLTKDHLTLLKNMYVSWDDCEFGAPCIDPKRPYGDSYVLEDMAKILKMKVCTDSDGETHLDAKQEDYLAELHKEMETALQIVLCTGQFRVGTYNQTEEYDDRSWRLMK